MHNRRTFFRNAGTFALGTMLLPACSNLENQAQTTQDAGTAAEPAPASGQPLGPIGMQLYSVKDVIENDLKGTLQQLADFGYQEVETYPGQKGHYFGMEPKEFATMISDMGMTLVSGHVSSGARSEKAVSWRQAKLLSRFEELVEKAAETGQSYLTCSWMDESLRTSPDELKRTAELFNSCGETCKQAGLQLAYHNHAFEFEKVGDTLLYDFMLEHTDPELVQWELDMYWVVAGGQDPAAYLTRYPNRFPLGHVKDMDKQDTTKNAVVGQGSIDYTTILKVAEENGMKHFLVEQETFTQPPGEAMGKNYQYLSQVQV